MSSKSYLIYTHSNFFSSTTSPQYDRNGTFWANFITLNILIDIVIETELTPMAEIDILTQIYTAQILLIEKGKSLPERRVAPGSNGMLQHFPF